MRHNFDILSDINFDILSDIDLDILSDIDFDILSDMCVYIYMVEAQDCPLESGAGIYRPGTARWRLGHV